MKELIEISNDSGIDRAFDLFQLSFPYTRLMRYDSYLVYTIKGNHLDKVVEEANKLISELHLPLIAERNKNSQVLWNTVLIRSDSKNDI